MVCSSIRTHCCMHNTLLHALMCCSCTGPLNCSNHALVDSATDQQLIQCGFEVRRVMALLCMFLVILFSTSIQGMLHPPPPPPPWHQYQSSPTQAVGGLRTRSLCCPPRHPTPPHPTPPHPGHPHPFPICSLTQLHHCSVNEVIESTPNCIIHKQQSNSILMPPPLPSSCNPTHPCMTVMQNWMKPKKKVGRPITYNGDPNAPELSEAERRKVKRRIANRESARRVQQRRKEMIDELQHKVWCYPPHHTPFLFPSAMYNMQHKVVVLDHVHAALDLLCRLTLVKLLNQNLTRLCVQLMYL